MIILQIIVVAFASIADAKVILISFDGFGANVYRQGQSQSLIPNFESLKKIGAFTLEAKTVMPSVTLVSHTSMLTGLLPLHHLVNWNDWKPEKGPITAKSIFDFVRLSGGKSALVAGKEKFRHFEKAASLYAQARGDNAVFERAWSVWQREQPEFLFIHFGDIDGAGHKSGWLSADQMATVRSADEIVLKLINRLKSSAENAKTTVIISADHGGHEKTHGSDSTDDMTIPWMAFGAKVPPSGEIRKPVVTTDTAATVLWLLDIPAPKGLDGRSVLPL